MRDVCFPLWSIDQKYIIKSSSPRATFKCWAKKLLVLKLRFFLHPPHLLQQTQKIIAYRREWIECVLLSEKILARKCT